MDQKKVSDYLFLIKCLTDSQEALLHYHSKVEIMVETVIAHDLIDYPTLKIHLYLKELRGTVAKATYITKDMISALNMVTTLLMYAGEPISD